jgi:hypothetical protein
MIDISDIIDTNNDIAFRLLRDEFIALFWTNEYWKLEFLVDDVLSPINDIIMFYDYQYETNS